MVCREWGREGCRTAPGHRDGVLLACYVVDAGCSMPLVIVPTHWERGLLHEARVAHRARIWTADEVRLLLDLHVDVAGARAVAEARIVFRANISQIRHIPASDTVGLRQGAMIPFTSRVARSRANT